MDQLPGLTMWLTGHESTTLMTFYHNFILSSLKLQTQFYQTNSMKRKSYEGLSGSVYRGLNLQEKK